MNWTVREGRGGLEEWERQDGLATVRKRKKGGEGGYVVRLDVLEQADDGPAYRRESIADEADADELAADWRAEFELDE